MGRREPAPMVPPAKAQVVERKTLQLDEFRFEARADRMGLVRDGRRCRFCVRSRRSAHRTRAQRLAHDAFTPALRSGNRR